MPWLATPFTDYELNDCWWRAVNGRPLSGMIRHEVEAEVIANMAGSLAEVRAFDEGRCQRPQPPADPAERENFERDLDQASDHLEQAGREAGDRPSSDMETVRRLLKRVSANEYEARAYEDWLAERTRTSSPPTASGFPLPAGRRRAREGNLVWSRSKGNHPSVDAQTEQGSTAASNAVRPHYLEEQVNAHHPQEARQPRRHP
jgi:hypothetical protein